MCANVRTLKNNNLLKKNLKKRTNYINCTYNSANSFYIANHKTNKKSVLKQGFFQSTINFNDAMS